ncbi:MAG: Lactaldehyde dehydrogenase [Candidatus Ordinivivax streblomastigis]|uniref:Lactaldehyde dehydrogenase n=1 Tax=Candidatus Ordinivivax streblomastigis TaxID=2540710 RepID=A0A5M8NU10_9BACT|nr:MAG: Lactaldehyde dehydrogenase [Candidatus Ordinivivax streblomastigis]
MKTYQQFINGSLTDSHSSDWIEVENPYTGEIISRVPKGDGVDAYAALEAAKKSQTAWAAQPAAQRAGYLRQMAVLIRSNRLELAKTLAAEQAKILPLAQVEIDFTADYFEYYAGWARIYEGEIIQSDRLNENILLFRKPIGVVVGICPWNFPFFVMARKVAPALLTGCTIVLKPSSLTPNTTFEFAKLVATLGLPKGVINFVSGSGKTLGNTLVKSPLTDMVTLTGSVEAGVEIIKATADNVTKVSLELGGKAPAIVFEDADLDLAVKGIVDSRVIYSGQVCNCAERAYVHKNVYDRFIDKFTKAMQAVTYGDPFANPVPNMSSQIDRAQQEKIDALVVRAKAAGAEVLTGGKKADTPTGYFYEPTVLVNCRQDMEIVQKEVFGPVIPVLPFSDYEEAIALANDCEYGLTSSVFTTNINTTMQAIKDLKFGETYVNREHFEGMQGFHAGWRKSGIGGADGKHGLMEYLQSQVAYIQF